MMLYDEVHLLKPAHLLNGFRFFGNNKLVFLEHIRHSVFSFFKYFNFRSKSGKNVPEIENFLKLKMYQTCGEKWDLLIYFQTLWSCSWNGLEKSYLEYYLAPYLLSHIFIIAYAWTP